MKIDLLEQNDEVTHLRLEGESLETAAMNGEVLRSTIARWEVIGSW